MANTSTKEATEARKRKAELKRRFGDFIRPNEDPEGVYEQWCKALFIDLDKDGKPIVDDGLLHFALQQAKAAGIDPRVPGQIYIQQGKVIIGIQGLVAIAENTGNYGGTTKPEFEISEAGKILSCSIGVHKVVHGNVIVSHQEVDFKEYTTGKGFWKEDDPTEDDPEQGKPKTMIKKVAHAHALRATFSVCAGLYIAEEMERTVLLNAPDAPPDIIDGINKAKTKAELESVIERLDTKEQKKLAPIIREKLKSLKK